MWKTRKEDEPFGAAATGTPSVAPSPPSVQGRPAGAKNEVARIGKSLTITGQIAGAEDLIIDGQLEGSIELRDHVLVVGPHGRVRAQIHAQNVVVHGHVQGNISSDRIELKSSATVVGDIVTQRIIIEDGAYLKGAVDVHKEPAKPEVKREAVAAEIYPKPAPASEPVYAGGLVEQKKA